MVISSPIRDESAQVIGVLAARLNLSRFYGLITNTVGLGLSGETVVGKRIDNEIVLMAPTRHAPNAPLNERFSIESSFGSSMEKAAMGQQGSERVEDYRGKCAYASWRPLPSLNWAMAVKMDCDEALGPIKTAYNDLLRLLSVVILIALLAALVTAHALVAPINALRNAADSISRGNLDVHLPIPPGDEIGDLADSFERMIVAIRFFRSQSSGEEGEPLEEGEAPDRTPTPSEASSQVELESLDPKPEPADSKK
jgi:HAMP domain-containing protein